MGTPLAWYPAPGYRGAGNNGHSGDLLTVGGNGYNWSSKTNGTNGMFLGFDMQSLHPCFASSPGRGLPLRCLSE
ncbi:hypothetical protein [uncultured Rikenella sp.]|uniref:hypothetical protein n=1 Tax=uncultured Rikenella sp. TaxID=368003 RepID=UPI0025CE9BF0|nr:hypothetical protein [uncultured Rikenella sp.]